MYIYRGNLDFPLSNSKHANHEGITIMFPSEFRLGDPVYTCWQWSASEDKTNVPCWLTGTIDSVTISDNGNKEISFYYGSDYSFDGTFSGLEGIEGLSLVVQSGNSLGAAVDTVLVFEPDSTSNIDPGVIVPRIYIGRLANWAPYSVDQLLVVVIPDGVVGEGKQICAYWQSTVAFNTIEKGNVSSISTMMNVQNVASSALFSFCTGYFNLKAILNLKATAEQQRLILALANPPNESSGPLTLELQNLGPPPSHRQPRGINDSTTVVTNDTNGIVRSSQNEASSLMHSPVEMGLNVVELTSIIQNMKLELSEKIDVLEQAVRDQDGTISRLESSLEAAQGQIELVNAKLLETEAAREKDRLAAQEIQEKLQRGYETELSDTLPSEADDSDLDNQSTSLDVKVDESYNNQPTQWRR